MAGGRKHRPRRVTIWETPARAEKKEAHTWVWLVRANTNHGVNVFRWVVYYTYGSIWAYTILNSQDISFTLQSPKEGINPQIVISKLAVTAVDRSGNESIIEEMKVLY